MAKVTYIDNEILEMNYKKDIDGTEVDMDIEISISYTLNFVEDERMCYGDAEITVQDESHSMLYVNIHSIGIFSYMSSNLDDNERKQIHRETLKEMNPRWRELIQKLTELADIPPIVIDEFDFDDAEVKLDYGNILN